MERLMSDGKNKSKKSLQKINSIIIILTQTQKSKFLLSGMKFPWLFNIIKQISIRAGCSPTTWAPSADAKIKE